MRKTMVLFTGTLLASAMLCSGLTWAGEADDAMDFSEITTVTTEGVLDFPLTFELLPETYSLVPAEYEGTSMIIHYTTDAYEDGVTYDKFARVYLPYGYDPDDTETKYNILYYQHPNAGTPNSLFDKTFASPGRATANTLNMLNNMFEGEHAVLDKYIIVCPTFYFDLAEDMTDRVPDDQPAGDGFTSEDGTSIPANYYLEVVEDLIPAVESQLNVYCTDFSDEGIRETREHRAFAGYSRGSMYTWNIFHFDLPYFKYFMPMSAQCCPYGNREASDEEVYQFLKEAIDSNPELDFFIFAASGGEKDAPQMRTQMKYLIGQTDTFSYGLDTEANNIYYTCSEFMHVDQYVPYYLYNARDVLFK